MLKKLVFFIGNLFILVISQTVVAQNKIDSSLDATMRSNGKIYVVVAVCLTILIGLFAYVFMLDKKISKMEKEQQQLN
jgi:Na+/proline symporter